MVTEPRDSTRKHLLSSSSKFPLNRIPLAVEVDPWWSVPVVRVATVLACYRRGMRVEEIVRPYSTLKPADVPDALAYAHDHLEEIEADLAADDEATVKARGAGGKSGQ